ncbi:MAG: glycosyltransferase family protein [Desulfitobacteriaceae bacterium]
MLNSIISIWGASVVKASDQQIICFGAAEWSGMWARAQQLMTRFAAAGFQVLYINPPITWLSPLKNPTYWQYRVRNIPKLEEVSPGIFVYTPFPLLPFANLQTMINKLNQYILARSLKKVLAKLKFANPILWTYLPNNIDILKHLPHSQLIYDCADEHASFPGFINAQVVLNMENRLLVQARIVFASALELYNRRVAHCQNIQLINNGADFKHFRQALNEVLVLPEEISSLPKPIVGYIGAISTWLDLELIKALAIAYPLWSIVLVGPQDIDLTELRAFANILFVGPKPYGVLPAFLKGFDLCLIPFKINNLTVNVNPVKLYEYLAAGKPVLATALPEVLKFSDHVAIANTKEDFVTLAAQEIAQDNSHKIQSRLEIALANSWDLRFRQMLKIIIKSEPIK